MFTTNYINMIKGTITYDLQNSNYSVAINANAKTAAGTDVSKIYGRATASMATSFINYAIGFLGQFFFAASPYIPSAYGNSSGTQGRMYVTLAQKESISPDDYEIDLTLNPYFTVSKLNGDIICTITNTGNSDISFNTIQISGGMGITSIDAPACAIFLLAEIDIGPQTIAPGYSKTFRLVRENIAQ